MDVVLLKDVAQLGAEGTVVTVKPGYARNYLIPTGLAALATAQHLKMLEAIKHHRNQQATRVRERALALKRTLESQSLTLELSVGEGGKPFGAITTHDVAQAIARAGAEIDKHAVHLEQPIKALGIYEVPVRLHPEVTAALKVWVVKAS